MKEKSQMLNERTKLTLERYTDGTPWRHHHLWIELH